MEITNRKSITEKLKVFHPEAKDYSFIDVTEWTNGEGWDITIDDKQFSLHYDELDAINFLTQYLNYHDRFNR